MRVVRPIIPSHRSAGQFVARKYRERAAELKPERDIPRGREDKSRTIKSCPLEIEEGSLPLPPALPRQPPFDSSPLFVTDESRARGRVTKRGMRARSFAHVQRTSERVAIISSSKLMSSSICPDKSAQNASACTLGTPKDLTEYQ